MTINLICNQESRKYLRNWLISINLKVQSTGVSRKEKISTKNKLLNVIRRLRTNVFLMWVYSEKSDSVSDSSNSPDSCINNSKNEKLRLMMFYKRTSGTLRSINY